MRAKTCLDGGAKERRKTGRLLRRALSWLLLPVLAVSALAFRPGEARGEEFIVSGEDDETSLFGAARVILGTMTLEEKVFQMFFVTPEQLTGLFAEFQQVTSLRKTVLDELGRVQ